MARKTLKQKYQKLNYSIKWTFNVFTSNKSVVKDHKADEDAIKEGEKHEKSIERILQLHTGENDHRENISY